MSKPEPHGNDLLAEAAAEAYKPRALKLRCVRGHEFNDENTYIRHDGKRSCKVCRRERGQAKRAGIEYPTARKPQPPKATNRPAQDRIPAVQHANNIAGLLHYFDRRNERLAQAARQKAIS